VAKNLFETINQTLQAKPVTAPAQDQTQQVQGLLRAKLGKATTGAGAAPVASNVQEQVANRQTQLQGQQLQNQGVVEAQQLGQQVAGQQVQLQEQQRELNQRMQDTQQRYELETDNLLKQFERGEKQLNSNKDQAAAEQLGFNLRLQDKQYLSNLEIAGAKSRIKDAATFGEEMARTTIGNNQALLKLGLDSNAISNASDREFAEMLGQMGIDEANQLFRDEVAHERRMAPYVAGSAILSGALSYATADSSKKSWGSSETSTTNANSFKASPQGPQSTNVTFGRN
jgi:hypothetical protein